MASSPQQPDQRPKKRLLRFGFLMFVLGFFTAVIAAVIIRVLLSDYLAEQADERLHDDQRIHAAIPSAQYCHVLHCGDVVAVACNPDADGPLDYYDNTTGKLLMECGVFGQGASGSKRVCPPPEWTCGKLQY